MKYITLIISTVFLLSFSSVSISDEFLSSYIAKLGIDDHYNSSGQRLKSVAAIIRQDRANYHKYGKTDPQDEYDSYFSSKHNRAKLERMLNRGFITAYTRRTILNGTPIIEVNIYRHKIKVYVSN